MNRLPEKIRGTLDKIVRSMKTQENVSAIGLFGSWSRRDATPTSDIDILIIDNREFSYEYADRIELNGLLIDLDYIPKKWITGPVPPEIDQKLYEVNVLYDRDWTLSNAKDWMSKSYRSRERIDIRTEAYLIDSDIYLSRSTSALAREDFQSSCLFANLAAESILKTLIEVNSLPISNSRLIAALEQSANKLEMPLLFAKFLAVTELSDDSHDDAEHKLKLFKSIWDEVTFTIKENESMFNKIHPRVKMKLRYYGNPCFLQGMILRSRSLFDAEMHAEACHFILRTLADVVENYAWLKSTIEGTKLDHTTLLRSLKGLERAPERIYENTVDEFNLAHADREQAEGKVKMAKEIIMDVRRQRKSLIERFVS